MDWSRFRVIFIIVIIHDLGRVLKSDLEKNSGQEVNPKKLFSKNNQNKVIITKKILKKNKWVND
jgi:hypothetical protein